MVEKIRKRNNWKLGGAHKEIMSNFKSTYKRPASVNGFCDARRRGTTRRTQRFERGGLNVGDLGSQRNTVMEALKRRTHHTLQRETPSFTQVQGPCGEVKPLLSAFLYYDAIPREEYKVLVTEL
jgi:hypothetical protein